MKKNDKTVLSIVFYVLAALWCIVVLAFVDHSDAGFYYWGGFVFGLVVCLLPAVLMLIAKTKTTRETIEISMLPGFLSVIFVFFGIVFNAIYVYIRNDEILGTLKHFSPLFIIMGVSKAFLVVVNILAILIYLILIYYLSGYASRVAGSAQKIGGKISHLGQIKSRLAMLLTLCNDDNVKKQILALKQKVDYSNNLAQKTTEDEESQFYSQLGDIEQLLRDNSDPQTIIDRLKEAEQIWNTRNAKLMADR